MQDVGQKAEPPPAGENLPIAAASVIRGEDYVALTDKTVNRVVPSVQEGKIKQTKKATLSRAEGTGGEKSGKKVDALGLLGFLISIGAWFTTGFFPLILFAVAVVFSALSLKRMSQQPERYALKTISFIALLISLVGLALSLYVLMIYLLS